MISHNNPIIINSFKWCGHKFPIIKYNIKCDILQRVKWVELPIFLSMVDFELPSTNISPPTNMSIKIEFMIDMKPEPKSVKTNIAVIYINTVVLTYDTEPTIIETNTADINSNKTAVLQFVEDIYIIKLI